MNEESRNKKKIFEIISKNRLIFAFAGSAVAIIANFIPMFQIEWFYEEFDIIERVSIWLYGFYEHIFIESGILTYNVIEWFGQVEEEKLGIASISIISTIIIGLLVLGTIIVASDTLIRKRKKGAYSSRILLYFSIGINIAVYAYMFTMIVLSFESVDIRWVGSPITGKIGINLLIISSVLILIGYTAKIKPLLKILSLFVASFLIYFGAISLTSFFWGVFWAIPPASPSGIPFQINRLVIPAIIAISCALVIVVINFFLYWRARKKRKQLN